MTSNRDDWETPQSLFDELNKRYHFTLDPCSNDANAKCEKHYTIKEDGLAQSWQGERVFCNPPYGRYIADWIIKAAREAKDGQTQIVMLMPARTDTRYFHDYIYNQSGVRVEFLRGRVKYELNGEAQDGAPFPSMLVFWNC